MAGSILKGFGIPLIALGILLLVAGIAAAAYGFYVQQENNERLLSDPNAEDESQTALLAGGAAAALGLVVLLIGAILNGAGNGRRHRELLRATAAGRQDAPPATTATTAPAPSQPRTPTKGSKKGAVIGLVSLGVLALAVLGLAALGDGGRAVGLGSQEPAFEALEFDGTVRNSFNVPGTGPIAGDDAQSLQEFNAPANARSVHLELTWDPADAGANELLIVVDYQAGGEWRELGRTSGASPVSLDLDLMPAPLRYRVFPAGEAAVVAEQPFHVQVTFA